MTALVGWDEVAPGDAIPALRISLRRVDLVMYAGASGDFNPIHWSDRVAAAAGLPGVIAHGMLSLAAATRAVTDWCGDPGAVVTLDARFSHPVVVPDDDRGAELAVSGVVAEKLPGRRVRVLLDLQVLQADGTAVPVLKQAGAVVQL